MIKIYMEEEQEEAERRSVVGGRRWEETEKS